MEPMLLIAIVLAFGFRTEAPSQLMPRVEALSGLQDSLLVILLQMAVAFAVGYLRFRRVGRWPDRPISRFLSTSNRCLEVSSLAAFAFLVLVVDWPGIVDTFLLPRISILVDDFLVLAPFLLMRVVTWACLYPAERKARALRGVDSGRQPSTGRYLLRRSRQAFGLVLPAILLYCLLRDIAEKLWPDVVRSPLATVLGMVLMGVLVLVLAPALVRLAWPTRKLPNGPLRDRLEHHARRIGFKYSDILIWESNGSFANAGVTGAVPWYRYVLLTDTLVDYLDEREVEAVFGHEVGHIVHRHLASFGLFFVGSLGVLSLLGDAVDRLPLEAIFGSSLSNQYVYAVVFSVEPALVLACLAVYFYLVFGFLSRRFERQADLFGCRAVSCDFANCPPHRDVGDSRRAPVNLPDHVCPVGIRILANALSNVALLNGIDPISRSWRHGSIAQRITFLESLEGNPDRERRFQRGIRTSYLLISLALLATFAVAAWTGALDQL